MTSEESGDPITGLVGFTAVLRGAVVPVTTDRVAAFLAALEKRDAEIYNIGVRPIGNDIGRGGPDAFGWPLSLATLLMKNLGGTDFVPAP